MVPLLITRPLRQSLQFSEQVEAALPGQFEPIISPLMEIVEEPGDLRLDDVQSLLFTSANGITAYAGRTDRRDIPALCVGDATARVARSVGLSATSAGGDVSALATLAAQSFLPGGGHFLHVRGAEAAGDIVGTLAAEGIETDEQIVYHRRPQPLTPAALTVLEGTARVIAPLFSPRTASIFAIELEETPPTAPLTIIALSGAVAEALTPEPEAELHVATAPNAKSLIFRLAELVEEQAKP